MITNDLVNKQHEISSTQSFLLNGTSTCANTCRVLLFTEVLKFLLRKGAALVRSGFVPELSAYPGQRTNKKRVLGKCEQNQFNISARASALKVGFNVSLKHRAYSRALGLCVLPTSDFFAPSNSIFVRIAGAREQSKQSSGMTEAITMN